MRPPLKVRDEDRTPQSPSISRCRVKVSKRADQVLLSLRVNRIPLVTRAQLTIYLCLAVIYFGAKALSVGH